MDKATDKQIYFLKNKGIDAANMSKQAASEIISGMKGGDAQQPSTTQNTYETESQPTVGQFKATPLQPKKTYDNTSYYVSYAKDLFISMIGLEHYKNVSPEVIMKNCIDCINQAKQGL